MKGGASIVVLSTKVDFVFHQHKCKKGMRGSMAAGLALKLQSDRFWLVAPLFLGLAVGARFVKNIVVAFTNIMCLR